MVLLARIILSVAAFDSLALGVWAVAQPDNLFARLHLNPPQDAFLWRYFGCLTLANALCLTVAVVWPLRYGGIVLVPWVGRLLSCGMWLWLLCTHAIAPAHAPLAYLLAHDAFWLLALTVFFALHYVLRRRLA
jgi:hypothetical protein